VSETETSTEQQTTEAPEAKVTEAAATETETTETQTTEPDDKPDEELPPEVLRKKLTDANAEAANYRTRLREAEQKLSEAKTPEEVAAAVADLTSKNAELERSLLVTKVASKYELPAELAELLKGDDEAALAKHAQTLAKFASPSDPESLSGGLTPGDSQEFDPVAEARKARQRR
jgi:hypothetical protein